jgi:hypothetical protein
MSGLTGGVSLPKASPLFRSVVLLPTPGINLRVGRFCPKEQCCISLSHLAGDSPYPFKFPLIKSPKTRSDDPAAINAGRSSPVEPMIGYPFSNPEGKEKKQACSYHLASPVPSERALQILIRRGSSLSRSVLFILSAHFLSPPPRDLDPGREVTGTRSVPSPRNSGMQIGNKS